MKNCGIIHKYVLNLYSKKSSDSEMVTQGILGHEVEILSVENEWLLLKTWDSYKGWGQSSCVSRSTRQFSKPASVVSLFTDVFDKKGKSITKLVITSIVDYLGKIDEFAYVMLPDGREGFVSQTDLSMEKNAECDIIQTAGMFLGVPYLWGGTTPLGIDCSGFVQLVFKLNGIELPRDACMQADCGISQPIEEIAIKAEDLLFFTGKDNPGEISHVGISLGDGRIIHSSKERGVSENRIEDLLETRIFHSAGRITNAPIPHRLLWPSRLLE